MSRVQVYRCEVCGLQERDHSNWLLVTEEPHAHDIDILKWDDKLAAQPGICHVCCAAHLQVLVGAWIMPDLGMPAQPAPAAEDPASLLSKFNLDRALSSGTESDRESLLAMLDVVEIMLKGSQIEEEEPTPSFDA